MDSKGWRWKGVEKKYIINVFLVFLPDMISVKGMDFWVAEWKYPDDDVLERLQGKIS